ncbi:MAG: DUF6659 family protein [Nitrosopumilaceae archaeon]
MSQTNNSSYEQKCSALLNEPEIRFAGVIDKMGNLIAGGMKDGIKPFEDETVQKKMFMEVALRVVTRSEFDQYLGEVEYSASRRKNVVVFSFPVEKNILLLSAEKHADIDETAKKVLRILNN